MYLTRKQAEALEDAGFIHTENAREIAYEEKLYGETPGNAEAHDAHIDAANHLWWLADTLGDTNQPRTSIPF